MLSCRLYQARLAWESAVRGRGGDPLQPQLDPDIDSDRTIECRLFYSGTREQLKLETKLVFDTPGGNSKQKHQNTHHTH